MHQAERATGRAAGRDDAEPRFLDRRSATHPDYPTRLHRLKPHLQPHLQPHRRPTATPKGGHPER